MAQCPKEELEYIINHVVLPPKLPQEAESPQLVTSAERQLLNIVFRTATEFQLQCAKEMRPSWLRIEKMLAQWIATKPNEDLSEQLLDKAIQDMQPRDVLPIRIRAQNAGLLLRHVDTGISIECFEISPKAAAVVNCKGSLRRHFPAHGVTIPIETAANAEFRHELCVTLKRLDTEIVHDMMPKSQKAGSKWVEFRDTCHPALVTELLMASLAAVGGPTQVLQVKKRIRDDVLWKNGVLPWRRSSLWLVLRVSIEVALQKEMESAEAFTNYKDFMVYQLAAILTLSLKSGISDDLCKVIQMKMARRAAKLGGDGMQCVQETALKAAARTTILREELWRKVQVMDIDRSTTVSLDTLEEDTALTLCNSRNAIDTALHRDEGEPQPAIPIPSVSHEWIDIPSDGIPVIKACVQSTEETVYALAEFERWVWESMPLWLRKALERPQAAQCTSISIEAEHYKSLALQAYSECPEQLSLMLLVIGELWRAQDTLAGILVPLLHEYSPEIPTDVFYPLLVPKRMHMERLQDLEVYIKDRHTRTKMTGSSILADPSRTTTECFAARYFDRSKDHQTLRQGIVADANKKREEKEHEWQQGTDRYNSLKKQLDTYPACEEAANEYGIAEHKTDCRRCEVKKAVDKMTISVFEWPLPKDEVFSKVVVFELKCPAIYTAWRNLTWTFVNDLGRLRPTLGKTPQSCLGAYSGLSQYFDINNSRIELAASDKAFTATHYREAHFPVELEQVLCDHGPHWKFHDKIRNLWIGDQTETPSFFPRCQIKLPEGPFENLQYAIDSTTHAQNDVLAAQAECSPGLNLHEYIAYGSLRADGEQTQWLNISRELRASNLTWNSRAVSALIKTSVWQAGTPNTTFLRVAHSVLEIPGFCTELLSTIAPVLRSIQANRKSIHTMNTLIVLLLRIASLASKDVTMRALELLRDCRSTLFQWTGGLQEALRGTTSAKQVLNIRGSLLTIALLCKTTFDINPEDVRHLLSSRENMAYWAASSIIVYDNTPGAESDLSENLRRSLLSDRKLSHALHRNLQHLWTTESNGGLDDAVLQNWSGFQRLADVWNSVEGTASRWIDKATPSLDRHRSQNISYNVLNGQLLVDGRPLGTLPKEFTAHNTFIRCFDAQILRVSSSDMAGMAYMTANEEHGYRFYFDLRADDLIVRAKGNSRVLELIPHDRLSGDFPTFLIDDHIHWLDLHTHCVEFRPLSHRWTVRAKDWQLQYDAQGTSYLKDDEGHLVDIRSRTYQATVSVLDGLEKGEFMHITRPFNGGFRIALPRLGLHFFMNGLGELECREIRKVVDQDQSLGTMIGLKSRLILCAKGERSRSLDRVVLLPRGNVSWVERGPNLTIHIETEGREVQCLSYQHNAILGRLEGDGSTTSRLFQAYLHALTSYNAPDPLTGNLGTETALQLLNEQVLRCCRPLDRAEVEMLNLIAALTPSRFFYPQHLRVMQQVSWHDNLNPLNQCSEFASVAENILAHTERLNIFYDGLKQPQELETRGEKSLLQRAKIRNAIYGFAEHGERQHSTEYDEDYEARDVTRSLAGAARVYKISMLVMSWTKNLATKKGTLADRWKTWSTVSGFGTVFNFTLSISELLKLEFSSQWAPLYEYCRQASQQKSQYKLLFLFGIIAYSSKVSTTDDLKTLLAFATNPSLQNVPPFPDHPSFTLAKGSTFDRSALRSIIAAHVKPPPRIKRIAFRGQKLAEYQAESNSNIDDATEFCATRWPCEGPLSIPEDCVKWLKIPEVNDAIQNIFTDWFKNAKCERQLKKIQTVLDNLNPSTGNYKYETGTWSQLEQVERTLLNKPLPTLADILTAVSAPSLSIPPRFCIEQQTKPVAISGALRSLIVENASTSPDEEESVIRTQYGCDLLASLDAFQNHPEAEMPGEIPPTAIEDTISYYAKCENCFLTAFECLRNALQPQDTSGRLLETAGFWPRVQGAILLGAISSRSRSTRFQAWMECIVTSGTVISMLQRARRLILAAENHDTLSFFTEAENPGQLGWNPHERPDWLLVEIENNFLIRQIQARVALEMIGPSSSSNTLMQLNMGEGKSSVIIPLIAAALADGKQLLRVVVLRSLTRQAQDTITRRLGGLARRPIYFMPFSRKTKIDTSIVTQMKALHVECMKSCGILLVQPEHILSFKLMGIERLVSEENHENHIAFTLLETQAWLDAQCRDVLDESDEILDVKFQLIYTLGTQRSMDGQPDRWLIMQGIFDSVQHRATCLKLTHQDQIELEKQGNSSFPIIRLLSLEVRELLIGGVFEDICASKVPGLVLSSLPPDVRQAVFLFIVDQDVAETDCKTIQTYCNDDEVLFKKLLLVRGLIAGGILLHALHAKRWSVNYGLHLTRCLCAVPYRAKGVPAATAEFGHPDMTIALTCLSYYFTGLTDHQLKTCLNVLQKADDPSAEYRTWTKADDGFPHNLFYWQAVNPEDHHQCQNQLFPALRYNKKVADFYLTRVVFPKEGKEFTQKLSTSGWDIPASPASGKVTTGFSGTNDSRFLLPKSISQHDLPELQHTSGKVLEFVSRPENLTYACARDEAGLHLSSIRLLQFLNRTDAKVRVLIDVGAQIIDLSNEQVIRNWLNIAADVEAGVYFDENDYAMVLAKTGKKEKLITSSFSNRMDRCIVYLDDVHTRGTDLKLPRAARAAVTLGPRLTKDRLVQACMRLRQLGHGQSLMFVAPPEVHQEIAKNTPEMEPNGLHVIKWALEQSCMQIERNQPLWITQGLNYYRRREAMEQISNGLLTLTENPMTEAGALSIQDSGQQVVEHEAQSLRDLYAPEAMREEKELSLVSSSRLKSDSNIKEMVELWDKIDPQATRGAQIFEEHEREVAQEVEQETQIERPPKATPEIRKLDPRIRAYICSATSATFVHFVPVSQAILQHSSSAGLLKARSKAWNHVRVSRDFAVIVKRHKASPIDNFVRPVHWLLLSKEPQVQGVLLISQYEVNQLFNEIHNPSSSVALIRYEPRVTNTMLPIDKAIVHALPDARKAWETLSPEIRQELHLFAGQLYFTTFQEYESLHESLPTEFAAPLNFIKEWMGIRRKGQNYLQTHIGQVVSGRLLQKEMFEEDDRDDGGFSNPTSKMTRRPPQLSRPLESFKSALSHPTSHYICLQCRHHASLQQLPSPRQLFLPASTSSFRRTYATKPSIADRVGFYNKFERFMNKRMWKKGEGPPIPDESPEKSSRDTDPRTDVQRRPQDGVATLPPRQNSVPVADDADYTPAQSGEVLEHIGGPTGWWEEAWDEEHQFQGFMRPVPLLNPIEIRAAIERSLVESVTLLHGPRRLRRLVKNKPRPMELPAIGDFKLSQTDKGEIVLLWKRQEDETDLRKFLEASAVADRDGKEIKEAEDGMAAEEEAEGEYGEAMRAEPEQNESTTVFTSPTAETEEAFPEALNNKGETELLAEEKMPAQMVKPDKGEFTGLRGSISLIDPELKFGVLKRVMQLTGIRIPDPDIQSIDSSHALYKALTTQPKPKKLAQVLIESRPSTTKRAREVNLPQLSEQLNVKIQPHRQKPYMAESALGRKKVIEKRLEEYDIKEPFQEVMERIEACERERLSRDRHPMEEKAANFEPLGDVMHPRNILRQRQETMAR
ncbi:MAG: hypothetical protein Q9170_007144 [Blastenia crenularia]